MVTGSLIIPLSDRFTRSTSSACRSIDMFLWMIPMPPSRAIAIAMRDSVTVSIAAATSGMGSRMERVSTDSMLVSLGCTEEWRGTSRTSSKVSPSPRIRAG